MRPDPLSHVILRVCELFVSVPFPSTKLHLALSGGDGEDITDPSSQLHRYRQFRYQKMQAELLELQNEATLKSGARGAEARKELRLFEIKVADAESQ